MQRRQKPSSCAEYLPLNIFGREIIAVPIVK